MSCFLQSEGPLPVSLLRYLPFRAKVQAGSIFHSSYYRVSNQSNVCNVVTVHDFTYEYFMKGAKKYVHHFQKGYAIEKAAGIICVSENTKKDLIKFYPSVNDKKIRVIHHGICETYRPISAGLDNCSKYGHFLRDQFLLFVGDRAPYKNFDMAVEVVSRMDNHKLIVVGGHHISGKEKDLLNACLPDRWAHYRGVSNEELNYLYNRAHCLIYPSLSEGFGMPVVEAMAAGCPVVAVKSSPLSEASGDAAIMVEEAKIDNFLFAIQSLREEPFRTIVIEAGLKHALSFSWDKCFLETVKLYEEVLGV